MDKKKIITIISIVVTTLIVATATVLIIYKNNKSVNAYVAKDNSQEFDELNTSNPSEEPTDETTEDPNTTPSPKTSPIPSVPVGTYYIKVNNQMNTVTIYTKDENGNYTVPVKAMVCSTGYASPKNSKYKTLGKWNWGLMIGGVYTQYETHITGNILFHSVPYLRRNDHNSLEYWLYDKLGTTCSAGCIRLTVADAKWIYDNCAIGTTVEFYSSSNPGPLGKPSAMKISDNVECRGWDPTDPDPNNPWRNVITSNPSSPETTPSTEPETPSVPTDNPIEVPSVVPSVVPSDIPSTEPSTKPTQEPTEEPTEEPTDEPTEEPTEEPTNEPVKDPTKE